MSTSFPPPPPADPVNPYSAPVTEIGSEPTGLDTGGDLAEAEAIRRAHIGHEASVRSLGVLHYLGAILCVIVVGSMAFLFVGAEPGGPGGPPTRMLFGGIVVLYSFITVLNLALGYGLRRLQRWARWTETILLSLQISFVVLASIIGAMSGGSAELVPPLFGLLISGYILYLMLSRKGTVVFSPDYKEIIARTPHIKYKTSLILKVAPAVFVAVIAVAILAAIVSGR